MVRDKVEGIPITWSPFQVKKAHACSVKYFTRLGLWHPLGLFFFLSFKKEHLKDAIIKDPINKGNEVTSLPMCVVVEMGVIHVGWGREAVLK